MLLESIGKGDRTAMHTLYARHNVRVYRFVLRMVRDTTMAEDLVSQVFLDVWRTAGQFEGAIAEQEGHHPDLHLSWGKVRVETWTHKINGLTESDFILAAKIDQIPQD